MNGLDPSGQQSGAMSDDLLKRLAQMLRDVGFGSSALQRLAGGRAGRGPGNPLGGGDGSSGSGGSGFGLVVTPPIDP